MRNQLITTAACLALAVSSSAWAQGRSGGAGGGPGGGMGAGPPISPPGQMGGGAGTANAARDIGAQRGQFGRDFAQQQRLTGEQYRALAEERKAQALALAQAARSGANIPENVSARIRLALQQDLEAWREEFKVGRSEWQAMRDQWLVGRKSLTAEQWAEQRAAWFAARDAWIAQQGTWASSHRP